jgi:heme oxygenase
MTATATGFAARLREQTQSEHTQAESVGFMTDLMGGRAGAADYVALLGQYYFIYEALERIGETFRNDPVAGAFVDNALLRSDSIAADLEYFSGPNWREALVPLAATAAYVERLETVASAGSAVFVAHHYIRYLGDLSGGQIIRVMVQRYYGIPDEGVNFLVFRHIPKPKPFKDAYRAALENAAWTEDERTALIAEVDVTYRLNSALFTELGQGRVAAAS